MASARQITVFTRVLSIIIVRLYHSVQIISLYPIPLNEQFLYIYIISESRERLRRFSRDLVRRRKLSKRNIFLS